MWGSPLRGAGSKVRLLVQTRNNLQDAVEVLVELHDGSLVATPVAVVRRREYRHQVLVVVPRVSVNDQLVGTTDEGEFVGMVELGGHVLAEDIAGATRRDAPAGPLVGVRPQEVAHRPIPPPFESRNLPFVGDLLLSVELADLVQSVEAGTESAVETEHRVLNERAQREVVE